MRGNWKREERRRKEKREKRKEGGEISIKVMCVCYYV